MSKNIILNSDSTRNIECTPPMTVSVKTYHSNGSYQKISPSPSISRPHNLLIPKIMKLLATSQ